MADAWIEDALADLPPSAKLVYKVLEYGGWRSQKDLVEETRLSPRTLRYAISQLKDEGLIDSRPTLYDARQTCYTLRPGDGGHRCDRLVDAGWVHRRQASPAGDDPAVRLAYVSTGEDPDELVPGSVALGAGTDLLDPNRQGIPTRAEVEELLGTHGVAGDTTLVLYDDESMYYAAYAYWILAYYGHRDLRLLDGGLGRWRAAGYPTTDAPATPGTVDYPARGEFEHVRALRRYVVRALSRETVLLDVRDPTEHLGEPGSDGDLSGVSQSRGHIPGAINVPWDRMLVDDGRFARRGELEVLFADADVTREREIIVYCGVGARSALVWFVLSELLDYPDVSNYDGSWTEWGNLVDVPIETG